MAGGAPPLSPGGVGVYPQGEVIPLGSLPIQQICPHCRAEIRTVTEKRRGLLALASGMALAMFGCVWGCCLVPCFLDDCLDTEHGCPDCHGHIGNYRRRLF